MTLQEESPKSLSPLLILAAIQGVFTLIVGLIFTLVLFFGTPADS